MKKIKVWVEINTVQRLTEDLVDVPDYWEELTETEKESYMQDCFEVTRTEYASGGYELIEVDEGGE